MIKWNAYTEKLTDQAFSRLLITSLVWIFLAMMGLCSVTWAYYGSTISIGTNTLEAGTYNAYMTVCATAQMVDEDGSVTEVLTEITPMEIEGTIERYAFEKDLFYRVQVDLADSTSNGYCKIYVDGLDTVYANMRTEDGIFTFLVRVSEETAVSIETRWGIYSGESAFENGETLALSVPATESDTEAPVGK